MQQQIKAIKFSNMFSTLPCIVILFYSDSKFKNKYLNFHKNLLVLLFFYLGHDKA
jgi:hypothetical protein